MCFYTNITDENGQKGEEYDELQTFLARIICEAVQRQDNYDGEIENILVNMLYHLINNFHYLTSGMEDLTEDQEMLERYHRIIKYIYNNYNYNITLQEIAQKNF